MRLSQENIKEECQEDKAEEPLASLQRDNQSKEDYKKIQQS